MLIDTHPERGISGAAFERVFDDLNVHRPCDTPSTPAASRAGAGWLPWRPGLGLPRQRAGEPVGAPRRRDADGIRPLLVLTSGAHRVDPVKLADLLGLEEISIADAEFVRSRTGFAIGGVPPLAHLEPPMTVVDVSLSRYETIWAAAGHPHTVFPTSYDELLRLTGGIPAEVT